MSDVPPKVFVSHASEDKARFVIPFATRLRERGIEAWVDQWEINPGDSLVDKLFEEGLKNADAVVIVLSQYSVSKPWVREELNTSIVHRIQRQCKIIPVVIDHCQVPECLKSTVWQRIGDLGSYDAELNKIVDAVYGHYEKPALGSPPSYVQAAVPVLPGLTRIDSIVLKLVCEKAIEANCPRVEADALESDLRVLGIDLEQYKESLAVLAGRRYLELDFVLWAGSAEAGRWLMPSGGVLTAVLIPPFGLGEYFRTYVPNADQVTRDVALTVVNEDLSLSTQIADALGVPHLLVHNVLEELQARGLLQHQTFLSGASRICHVSPELRRWIAG